MTHKVEISADRGATWKELSGVQFVDLAAPTLPIAQPTPHFEELARVFAGLTGDIPTHQPARVWTWSFRTDVPGGLRANRWLAGLLREQRRRERSITRHIRRHFQRRRWRQG